MFLAKLKKILKKPQYIVEETEIRNQMKRHELNEKDDFKK